MAETGDELDQKMGTLRGVTPQMAQYAEERVRQALKHQAEQEWASKIETELKGVHKAIETANHIKEQIIEPVLKITQDVERIGKQTSSIERQVTFLQSDEYAIPAARAIAAKMNVPLLKSPEEVAAVAAIAAVTAAKATLDTDAVRKENRMDTRLKVPLAIIATVAAVVVAWIGVQDHMAVQKGVSPTPSSSSSHHP